MDKNNLLISTTLVALLKGVVSEAMQPKLWNVILENQIQIEDYVSRIGLTIVIQGQDGYAYLRQCKYDNEEQEIPRLISKRQLGFGTSLLLVILRKELIEISKSGSEERFIISKQEIIEKVRPYLKDTNDEAKQKREIETAIKKIEEMGFLRVLKNSSNQYEILPLVRGFVDAQWLDDFDRRLQEYMEYHSIGLQQGDETDEFI